MTFLRKATTAACAIAIALGLLVAPGATAQTDITTARLTGRVVDQDGQPLPGVAVEAKNRGTGLVLTQTTDPRGMYRIVNVPVGTYDLKATLSGFQAQTHQNIVATIGASLGIDFKLSIAGVTEAVTVTATAPVVETTQTETTSTVDASAIQSLPIQGRNFTDFVLLTPNAQRETQRGNIALDGQRGINTMITVDGVDFTNSFFGGMSGAAEGRAPISISQESVREFQVVQAGASAEYGRSGGGFVNVITKSGSNDFHGSLLGYYRPSDWSAKQAPAYPGGSGSQTRATDPRDSQRNNLGASLGGPVMKDQLFFFATYERQRQDTTIPVDPVVQSDEQILAAKYPGYPVSDTSFKQGSNADSYFGRLDFQINDANRVTGRANYTKFDGPSATTSSTTSATAHNGIEGMKSLSTVLQWNGMFGKNAINDLNLQYGTEDTPRVNVPAGAGLPELQIYDGGPTLGGYYFLPITATQKRLTAYDAITYLFGQHVFKLGAEYNYNTMDQVFKGSWRGVFLFQSAGGRTALQNLQAGKWNEYREFVGLNGKTVDEAGRYNQPQKEYAGFLQDTWFATPKLTATLGVRYEYQQNPSDPILDANKLTNPNSGIIQPDAKIPSATNQWSPRLSLAYSFDSKTVARLSLGRYYARFPAILTSQLYTTNGVSGTTFSITGMGANGPGAGVVAPGWGDAFNPMAIQQLGALPPGAKLPPLGVFTIDPNFKNPHTDQLVLSGERELFGLSFGFDAQYSKGYNLERLTDINLVASTNPTVDCPNLDPNSGVTCYGLYNTTTKKSAVHRLNPAYSNIYMYTSDARSEFYGVTLKVRKNFSNGFRFYASATRGTDRDTDSNERNYSGIQAEDVNNENNMWSYSDRDIKWRFLGNVSYETKITSWLNAFSGIVFNYQTGRPFTPLLRSDYNVDGQSGTDRPTVNGEHIARNSYRYPDFYTLDVRLGIGFNLGPGKASIFGECFNCTNTANRGISNTQWGSSTFDITNTSTPYPRSLQAAVRYDF